MTEDYFTSTVVGAAGFARAHAPVGDGWSAQDEITWEDLTPEQQRAELRRRALRAER